MNERTEVEKKEGVRKEERKKEINVEINNGKKKERRKPGKSVAKNERLKLKSK